MENLKDFQGNYGRVTSLDGMKRLADILLEQGKMVSFDVETGYTGPDKEGGALDVYWPHQFVVGFSITNDVTWARYVPLLHDFGDNLDPEKVWPIMKPVLEELEMTNHNSVFELRNLHALEQKGHGPAIRPDWNKVHCTMVQSYVLGDAVHPMIYRMLVEGRISSDAFYARTGYYPPHLSLHREMLAEAGGPEEFYSEGGPGEGLNAAGSHGLKYLSAYRFNYQQTHIHDLFYVDGKKPTEAQKRAVRYNPLPITPEVINYVCDDVTWGLRHDRVQRPLIMANGEKPPSLGFIYRMEREIIPILVDMADVGISVNWEGIHQGVVDFERFYGRMEAHTRKLFEEATGRDLSSFNFRSVPQLRTLLFDPEEGLGLEAAQMTDKGAPSTSETSLEAIRHQHPAVDQLLKYRSTKKMGEWFELWSRLQTAYDEKVHPSFNQVRIQSGRFASDAPNVQNITKKWWFTTVPRDHDQFPPGEKGDEAFEDHVKANYTSGVDYWTGNARDYLIASEDFEILTYDYSQQELRVLAGLSGEPYLLKAFDDGLDIHQATAALMFGVPIDQVTKDQRQKGKTINFGNVYGQSPKGMGDQLGISKAEAQRLYDQYFSTFSKVSVWFEEQKAKGLRTGLSTSFFGRQSRIWEQFNPNSKVQSKAERMYVNVPVQGGGADITKLAMIRVKNALTAKGWWMTKVRLLMNQHDSLVFEVHKSLDLEEVRQVIKPQVSFPVPGFPVFAVDWERGPSWGASVKWKEGEAASEVEPETSVQRFEDPSSLTVQFSELPTEDVARAVMGVLRAHPGQAPVEFVVGEQRRQLPLSVEVSPAVVALIRSASNGTCTVAVQKEDEAA